MTLLRRGWDEFVKAVRLLPLRVRLVATLLGLLIASLVLTSLATAYLTQRDLIARIDSELAAVAGPVANQALQDLRVPVSARTPTNYAFVLMDADGEAIQVVNPTGEEHHPAVPRLPLNDPRVLRHIPFTISSTDGEQDWRFIAGRAGNNTATFAVGVPLRSVESTITRLVFTTVLISCFVLLLMGLIGWYAVNRAFRPLRRIEDTAAKIAAGDLTQRIPVGSADDEVTSLTRSLNMMLARIESAFEVREASETRMRRFVADASHELRTPLATVQGYAELYRQGAVAAHDVGGAMHRIESEAHRMSLLVEDLLQLARLDQHQIPAWQEVDLTVVAMDAIEDARVRSGERRIRVGGRSGPLTPTIVRGADNQLRQVVVNLLENALQHTPSGTPVEVLVGAEGREAVILVRDHGAGIPLPERPKIFERFYRADASRGRENGGSGLGLPIVAAIAEAHRGRVGVGDTPGGGATFIVRLPLAETSTDPDIDPAGGDADEAAPDPSSSTAVDPTDAVDASLSGTPSGPTADSQSASSGL